MNAVSPVPDVLFWLLAAGWLVYVLGRVHAMAQVPPLPPADRLPSSGSRVSVIVTARDEEARIDETVRRLLEQHGVDLELIVVDDRSTDGTAAILEALARDNPRIRHVRVGHLPEGWLGKTHACAAGAAAATGEWLLFTDADSWMAADLVSRAMRFAERDRVDHLCLFPREHRGRFGGRATQVFLAVLASPISARVNRGARGAFAGVGAFNLVRSDAYRAVGGHDRLRLAVVDDVGLGLLLHRAGFRSRVLAAFDDLEIDWAPTARGVIRALEKNMFAVLGYSVPLAALLATGMSAVWLASVAGPFTGRPAGIAAGVAWALTGLPGLVIARRGRFGVAAAIASPLMAPVVVAAIVNSAVKTLSRGGVRWRGTFYPLEVLAPTGVWHLLPAGFRETFFPRRRDR